MPIKTETETPPPHNAWNLANAESVDIFSETDEWMGSGFFPSQVWPCGLTAHLPMLKSGNIEICEFRVNAYEEELEDVLGTDLFL